MRRDESGRISMSIGRTRASGCHGVSPVKIDGQGPYYRINSNSGINALASPNREGNSREIETNHFCQRYRARVSIDPERSSNLAPLSRERDTLGGSRSTPMSEPVVAQYWHYVALSRLVSIIRYAGRRSILQPPSQTGSQTEGKFSSRKKRIERGSSAVIRFRRFCFKRE